MEGTLNVPYLLVVLRNKKCHDKNSKLLTGGGQLKYHILYRKTPPPTRNAALGGALRRGGI